MLMPGRNKKRLGSGWLVLIIFMGLIDLVLILRRLLQGNNVALFNPKGLIAQEQLSLMMYIASFLFAIGIPSVFLLYFIAWKYRETNPKATYDPSRRYGKLFNYNAWAIPGIFMLVCAFVMWPATHRLVPQKLIAADAEPLTIQVVSMRWKWLFIYPDQGIATVNFVQVPVNTPIQFELTADESPMSSFWIPNLGGQLYAMTGHVNRLNLIAETPGDYPGSSAEITGAGFSGMKFTARASNAEDFDLWVREVKQSGDMLDTAQYESVLKPSENNPAAFYAAYDNDLYDKVVMKYNGPLESHMGHE